MAGAGWLSKEALATVAERREELGSPVLTMQEVSNRKLQGEHLIVIEKMVFFVGEFMRVHPGTCPPRLAQGFRFSSATLQDP